MVNLDSVIKKHNIHAYLDFYLNEVEQNSKHLVYVDIGSCDGIIADPMFDRLKKNTKWVGYLVEPIPDIYERLVLNYKQNNMYERFKFINKAIGESRGVTTLYMPFADMSQTGDHRLGVSSIYDREAWHSSQTTTIEVPAITISDLLEEHKISHITLLKLDTEGYDWHILKTLDLKKYQPVIIYSEHFWDPITDEFNDEKEKFLVKLRENGYRISRVMGRAGEQRMLLAQRE